MLCTFSLVASDKTTKKYSHQINIKSLKEMEICTKYPGKKAGCTLLLTAFSAGLDDGMMSTAFGVFVLIVWYHSAVTELSECSGNTL